MSAHTLQWPLLAPSKCGWDVGPCPRRRALWPPEHERMPTGGGIGRRPMGTDLMREAPTLPAPRRGRPVPRTALLVNPFYAKDPCASFGKHVLTPSLALTSIAGATPSGWQARYWDENLLQGPPPVHPLPQVVGITVHLTFAARAYELAAWFRAHGCTVVLGGLHALSRPDEVACHADAVAIGDGTQTGPGFSATSTRASSPRAITRPFAGTRTRRARIAPYSRAGGSSRARASSRRRGARTAVTSASSRRAGNASPTRCGRPRTSPPSSPRPEHPTASSSTTTSGRAGQRPARAQPPDPSTYVEPTTLGP